VELQDTALSPDAKRILDALLIARGVDVSRTIHLQ
jgi:hypothetical protein